MASQTENSTEHGLAMPRRLWAVVSVSAGSMLYTLDGSIANVGLPVISDALHIHSSTAVLLVSVYNLVLAMVLLPFAAIGERVGHRRMFQAGLAGYLLASTGCALANTFPALLLFRALQALAAASLLSVSLAMVRMIYPPDMLGRGLGFNTMASSLGAAVAPALGGLLIAHGPWHVVFAAGIPLALIGLAASSALPDTDEHRTGYDTRGALLCAVTFGLLIGGFQSLTQGAPGLVAGGIVAAGGLAAVLFVLHERKAVLPVLPVDLLAQPALALSVGGALLAVLASITLMLYLPFRLHELGFGSAAVGAMIAPYAMAVMVAAPMAGMLSDRISPSVLGTIGTAIAVVGLLGIAGLPAHPTYGDVAWRTVLCGVGFSFFFSPNGRLVVGSVPRQRAAGASSLLSTTRMFGQALGSTALAGMLALRLPSSAPALVAAALATLALLCSAARMVVRSNGPDR